MARYQILLLSALAFAVAACDSGGSGGSSNDSVLGDETDNLADTSNSSCSGGVAPASGAGTIVIKVDAGIDACTASGFVVGANIQGEVATDGTLIFQNVPPGSHDVIAAGTVAISGAALTQGPTNGVRLNDVEVSDSDTTDLGEVTLPVMGKLAGTATLANATDFAGINVYIPGTQYSATTDSAGSFQFDFLPVGVHNVYFERFGYYRGIIEEVTIESAMTTTLDPVELFIETQGVGGIVINNNDAYTSDFEVNVTVLPTDGAIVMKISEDENFADATFEPLKPNTSYTFDSEGEKTLYIQFANANGQNSSNFSDVIFVDKTAPVATLELNSGASQTSTQSISYAITATDLNEITEMRFGYASDLSAVDWQTYADTGDLTLPVGDGDKTVYVQVKDASGLESEVVSDSILLDSTAPTLASSSPADGDANVDASNLVFEAVFDESLNTATVTSDAITVRDQTGIEYTVTPTVTTGDTTIEFSLIGLPGAEFEVVFEAGIEDIYGNATGSDITVAFKAATGWTSVTDIVTGYNGNAAGNDPDAIFDIAARGQRAVIAYNEGNYTSPTEVPSLKVRYFENGAWQAERIYTEDEEVVPGMLPAVAINSSGRAVVAWVTNGDNRLYVAEYIPGSGWQESVRVLGEQVCPNSSGVLDVDINDSNDIIVARHTAPTGMCQTNEIEANVRRGTGNFSSAITIDDDGDQVGPLKAVISNGGHWIVAFDNETDDAVNYAAYDENDSNLNAADSVPLFTGHPGASHSAIMHDLAIDDSNTAAIIFRLDDSAGSPEEEVLMSIFTADSNTGTDDWDTPISIVSGDSMGDTLASVDIVDGKALTAVYHEGSTTQLNIDVGYYNGTSLAVSNLESGSTSEAQTPAVGLFKDPTDKFRGNVVYKPRMSMNYNVYGHFAADLEADSAAATGFTDDAVNDVLLDSTNAGIDRHRGTGDAFIFYVIEDSGTLSIATFGK